RHHSPDHRLAHDERAGCAAVRARAAGRRQPRIRARSVLAHGVPGRGVHRLVHRAAAGARGDGGGGRFSLDAGRGPGPGGGTMTTTYGGGPEAEATRTPVQRPTSAPALPSARAPGAGAWSPDRPAALPRDEFTGDLVCTALTPVTHDVLDLTFRACDGGTLPFSPGQYYTFTFPQVGVDRCYSVSSTPSLGVDGVEEFTITVKRVPGGPVSTFLHERFHVGDTVRADGPYGVFGSDVRP